MTKHRIQSPVSEEKYPESSSPMPSARAGVKHVGSWNLCASSNQKRMSEKEWFNLLKSLNAPIGFTHNDLSLYGKGFEHCKKGK